MPFASVVPGKNLDSMSLGARSVTFEEAAACPTFRPLETEFPKPWSCRCCRPNIGLRRNGKWHTFSPAFGRDDVSRHDSKDGPGKRRSFPFEFGLPSFKLCFDMAERVACRLEGTFLPKGFLPGPPSGLRKRRGSSSRESVLPLAGRDADPHRAWLPPSKLPARAHLVGSGQEVDGHHSRRLILLVECRSSGSSSRAEVFRQKLLAHIRRTG